MQQVRFSILFDNQNYDRTTVGSNKYHQHTAVLVRPWMQYWFSLAKSIMIVDYVLLKSSSVLTNFVAFTALIICYVVDIPDMIFQQGRVFEMFPTVMANNITFGAMDVSIVGIQVFFSCKML